MVGCQVCCERLFTLVYTVRRLSFDSLHLTSMLRYLTVVHILPEDWRQEPFPILQGICLQ